MVAGLKTAAADGCTMGAAGTDTLMIVPYKNADVDFTYEDFDFPGSGMQINLGLVALADRPYDTLEEFVAYAKEEKTPNRRVALHQC